MNRTLRTSTLSAALLTIVLGVVGCGSKPAPEPAPSPAWTSAPAPPTAVGKPTRVEIPAIGVDARLTGIGLNADGSMHTPNPGDAGWYDLGPRPGAPGPAVLVAHVHSPAGPDVFAKLHELEPGDRVTVHRRHGASTFVVVRSERVAKTKLPYDRIWGPTTDAVLRLITCGGDFDPQIGGYPDNTIVYAKAV